MCMPSSTRPNIDSLKQKLQQSNSFNTKPVFIQIYKIKQELQYLLCQGVKYKSIWLPFI